MKTAGELAASKCLLTMSIDESVESIIKQNQLDAMKEGMRRAAAQYRIEMRKHYPQYMPVEELSITQAILTAAEQLTEKDL